MSRTGEEIKNAQNGIVKLKIDLGLNQEIIAQNQRKEKEAADEVAKFGPAAANGDSKAREKYDRAKGTETLHREQARILQGTDGRLQKELTEAHATLNRLLLREKIETLIGKTGKLRAISTGLSAALAAPAKEIAAFKKEVKEIYVSALEFLGDQSSFAALEKSINQSPDRGVRAQLQKSFGAVGIVVVESKRDEGADFESVMEKPIADLMAALATVMHSNSGEHVEGRARFLVRTKIFGLHGISMSPGQIASLDPNDLAVQRVIAAGGLERIEEEKAVSS
jgi:hypothetical protein